MNYAEKITKDEKGIIVTDDEGNQVRLAAADAEQVANLHGEDELVSRYLDGLNIPREGYTFLGRVAYLCGMMEQVKKNEARRTDDIDEADAMFTQHQQMKAAMDR
jgi:hypothetical protein